jgi:hypothetical protein
VNYFEVPTPTSIVKGCFAVLVLSVNVCASLYPRNNILGEIECELRSNVSVTRFKEKLGAVSVVKSYPR